MDLYKQHKETETKLHEALYTNLVLLSGFYPTTKEFDATLKRDMFVKNNKTAFYEVIYYLLNILNSELTKKHLASWPPYDLKREAKFRTELMGYINTLNSMYQNADIPACHASSLISPGGFRFTKFMLKISELVMYEHLKQSGECHLLLRIKPCKNLPIVTTTQISQLKAEVQLIEGTTKESLQKFDKNYADTKQNATVIENRSVQLNKDIQTARKQLEEAQLKINKEHTTSFPLSSSLAQQLLVLKQQLDKLMDVDNLFNSSEKLLKCLDSSMMTLEHNSTNCIGPSEPAYTLTSKGELDLCQYFRGLALLLEKMAPQLQSPTVTCMQQTKENIEHLRVKDQRTLRQLELEQERIINILNTLTQALRGL